MVQDKSVCSRDLRSAWLPRQRISITSLQRLTDARALLSTWPVAHSKFGSCRWALPVMKHSQRTANCPSPRKNSSASDRPLTSLFSFRPFNPASLPPSTPQLLFRFFSPCAGENTSPTRTLRHFAATAIPYAIIGSRCKIRSRWERDRAQLARFLYTLQTESRV